MGSRKFKATPRKLLAQQRESRLRFRQDEVTAFFVVVFVVCCGAYMLGLLLGGQTLQ